MFLSFYSVQNFTRSTNQEQELKKIFSVSVKSDSSIDKPQVMDTFFNS